MRRWASWWITRSVAFAGLALWMKWLDFTVTQQPFAPTRFRIQGVGSLAKARIRITAWQRDDSSADHIAPLAIKLLPNSLHNAVQASRYSTKNCYLLQATN